MNGWSGRRRIALLIGAFLALAWGLYAALIEPNRLVVETVRVPIAGLPAELDGLRIAQVSDLHLSALGWHEQRAAEQINALEPDLVAMTGDLLEYTVHLDQQKTRAAAIGDWLRSLNEPPLGIWVSRGNRDISRYQDFNNALSEEILSAGAHLLANTAEPVSYRGMAFWLAGADFADFPAGFVSDFRVQRDAAGGWLEAGESTGNSTLNWWEPAALDWANVEYSGRFRLESAQSGLGLIFYSGFPAGLDRYYRLRTYAGQPSLQITAHGTSLSGGQADVGLAPEAGRWYRFRLQAFTEPTRTRILGRVWLADAPEPADWAIDCYDDSPTRLTAGTVGLWALGDGQKAFDDLAVRRLDGAGEELLAEDFEGRPVGRRPAGWIAYGINAGNVEQALANVPADAPAILLAHSPMQALEAPERRIALILAGHTHGGQIRLPGIGTPFTGTPLGSEYAAGLFHWGTRALYISRGLGTSGLPLRFLVSPEVTLLVLERAEK